MNRDRSFGMARFLRYPLLLLFLCSGFVLDAQTPSSAKPEQTPPKQATPSPLPVPKAQNGDAVELLFKIRSAFSLTPAMIHGLQTKGADSGGTQANTPQGTAPQGTAPQGGAPQGATAAPKASPPSVEGAKDIVWGEALERVVPFAAPLDVRLVGKNVVVLFQILPIALRATIVDLIVQGQVWVKMPDDSVSFKTTVQSLSLPLGSKLYFYPLGVDAKTGAPIAVEIRVDRQPKQ